MKKKIERVFYLYKQEKLRLPRDVYDKHDTRLILSEEKLTPVSIYDKANNEGVDINKYLSSNWINCYKEEGPGNDWSGARVEIINQIGSGWGGLDLLIPNIPRDMVAKLVIETEYDDTEAYSASDNSVFDSKEFSKPDFILEHDYMCVDEHVGGFILGFGNDTPDYDIDCGSIEWDVRNRSTGAGVDDESILVSCLPFAKNTDGHGVNIPFKVHIKVYGILDYRG